MTNKKLLAVASIAVVVSASSAFAKTEGNYVGVDLLRSASTFQYQFEDGSKDPKVKDNGYGVGLNYKYAFNIDNFFIAPGAFLEMNNVETTKDWSGDKEKFKINNRYGLKADIGYDVVDNFAVYLTGGIANVNYEYSYQGTGVSYKQSRGEVGYFYGLGLAYSITKEIAFNAEYNKQESMDIKLKGSLAGDKINTDLSVAKIGVSYKF